MALEEKARFRARMEELGEQQVRLLCEKRGGLPMHLLQDAREGRPPSRRLIGAVGADARVN
jgi:hypothetical protein